MMRIKLLPKKVISSKNPKQLETSRLKQKILMKLNNKKKPLQIRTNSEFHYKIMKKT